MASLNTNAAAITALRTLQQTNSALDKTQNKVSTGYKIAEAKDNAAYWAISTTLKSDNKSLGTVKDALGLGASTVDVAYQGLNKAKDVLDEIKSKLTASTQDGVDRDTIQNEIKQLQDQLKSISTSSVFSGENWLSVDTSINGFNPEKQVVASFSRDANGAVSIGTIKVQTASVALFDASSSPTAGGIIDGAVNLKSRDGRDLTIGGTDVTTGNDQKAGLKETAAAGVTGGAATKVTGNNGTGGAKADVSTSTLTAGNYASGDRITIKFNLNGTTTTVTTAALAPAGAAPTIAEVASAIDAAMTGIADVSESPANVLKFESTAVGVTTKFDLEQFTLRDANGKVKTAAGTPAASAASFETDAFSAITLDGDDHLYFKIQTDDATAAKNITIDRALIDKTLAGASHVSGVISTSTEFRNVLAAALNAAGVKDVNVATSSGGTKITFTTDSVGASSKLFVSEVAASKGGDTISVENIDISNAKFAGMTSGDIKAVLSAYVEVVNTAINKVTSAAAALGSVASRIDMQKSFVNTLMDTIDKGVGNLIDADMSEESTRLQALQVKQQLGVQALSIANQSSQNILSLFQSNG